MRHLPLNGIAHVQQVIFVDGGRVDAEQALDLGKQAGLIPELDGQRRNYGFADGPQKSRRIRSALQVQHNDQAVRRRMPGQAATVL